MALYFSAHTTACLTKQALRDLMQRLLAPGPVRVRRCVASQLAGRMLMETEAPDGGALEAWFKQQHLNVEWLMRIDLDAQQGAVRDC